MASTNIQTFPGKVGVSNTNPIHTLDIGSNVYIDDTAQTKLRIIGNIHASGVTVDGTITAIDSENLSVKDPIILLASGSTGTSDTGIIMKRADGDSNVAVFYDEGVGLKIGHTLSTAQDIHISVDSSNSLSTSIYGPVTVAHSSAQALVVQGGAEIADDFKVGASKLFVDVSESNVGIGTDAPLATLDVHGTANVGALTVVSISGDGSGLSSIQSSNVSDFASNVTRIGTLETDLGSNVTRIGTLETDLGSNVTRIGTLETDLGSNVTRITNLESSDMTIGGEKTFSSSLTVGGDVTVTDTTSGSAAGPEFSLYRNQTGTNGDYLGQLRFDGKHDGGNDQLYAKITGKIKKADQGGEDGVIETAIITDGSQRVSLRHTGDLFHIKKGTDFQVGETANLYVDTSTSRVGIGMSNPSYTLDVDGHINLSTGSTLKINGTDAVFSRWTASGSDIYRSSGNVGIGTTSPAAKFDVRGASHDPSIPTVHIGDNVADAGDYGMVNLVRDATSGGSKAHLAFIRNGNTIFGMGYYNNTNTFGLWPSFAGVTNTPAISIDTAGDIGIGTASPFAKLVIGSSASGSSDMDILGFRSINNTAQQRDGYKQRIGFYGKEEYNNNERLSAAIDCIYGDNVHIPTYPGTSSTNIAFTVHGRSNNLFEAMRIQHDGNVGIGTVSPAVKLDVSGVGRFTTNGGIVQLVGTDHTYLEYYPDGTSAGRKAWVGYGSPTDNNFTINNDAGSGHIILSSGNVGIGTASPGGKLDVVASSEGNYIARFKNSSVASDQDARIVIEASDAGGESQILLQTTNESTTHKWNIVAGSGITPSLGFQYDSDFNGGTFAMNILHGGNVGIGLTSPAFPLDVDGVSRSRGVVVNSGFNNNTARPALSSGSTHPSYEIRSLGGNGNVGSTGADDGFLRLRAGGGTSTANASYIDLSGYSTYSGGDMKRNIVFGTLGTERMRIKENGNVGIGTASPGAKLDVVTSSSTPALWLRNSTNGSGCVINMTDLSDSSQFGTLTYLHVDGSSLGSGNRLHFSTNQGSSVFSVEGTLMIGVDGKDNGYMANSTGAGRKNLWIQSTFGGNTSQNYGWWIGAQNQALSASDNDLYFAVVRNGTLTTPALIQDNTAQAQMNFTGQHRTFVKGVPTQQLEDKEGLIVSADQNDFIRMSGGVARGNEAITTNESLPIVSFSTKSNDKKCFGVVSTTEDPENRVEVYGNFASNMRKEVGDTRVYINSVGEGAVWVTDINGSLESGDYITTSNVTGYGMRQEDDILHNYTVAKITMDCDFNPRTQPKKIIKKELANVDYWIDYATSEIKQEEYETLPENEREIREDKYYKIYKREIQKTNPENDNFVHEVNEELVNVLDEHGQLQWEDDPSGTTEKAYKIRYLDTDGNITDEANAVHIAAFVGCTYHCG